MQCKETQHREPESGMCASFEVELHFHQIPHLNLQREGEKGQAISERWDRIVRKGRRERGVINE